MASIDYEDVYSRFFTKVKAYDLIFDKISDGMAEEFMHAWLRSAISYPYIRRLFATIKADDDVEVIDFTMRYEVDEEADIDFVEEVLGYSMLYAWLEPKVNSITNISQNFAVSEQKFYSQAAHLSELRGLRDDVESKIRGLIRDRGYLYNGYLDGTVKV
jgi:hypothetical protein